MAEHPVFISTGAFDTPDLEAVLEAARTMGIRHLELSSGVRYRADNLERVRQSRDTFSFLVHNYFPPPETPFVLNLASGDPEILRRSREHCRAALELSAELGAPFFSAHPGFTMQPRPDQLGRPFGDDSGIPHAEALANFTDSVRGLLADAAELNVDFLIENNVVAPFNLLDGRNDRLLMAEPEEMLAFAEAVSHPRFGYLMDVGHLNVSAYALGFERNRAMDALAPLIRAFHLSDNDGTVDSNQVFDSDAWFLPWLKVCPGACVVIEAYRASAAALAGCTAAVRAWR